MDIFAFYSNIFITKCVFGVGIMLHSVTECKLKISFGKNLRGKKHMTHAQSFYSRVNRMTTKKLLRINKQTLITAWFNLTKGHFESKICKNLKESLDEMDEIIKNVLNDVFLF